MRTSPGLAANTSGPLATSLSVGLLMSNARGSARAYTQHEDCRPAGVKELRTPPEVHSTWRKGEGIKPPLGSNRGSPINGMLRRASRRATQRFLGSRKPAGKPASREAQAPQVPNPLCGRSEAMRIDRGRALRRDAREIAATRSPAAPNITRSSPSVDCGIVVRPA